MKLLLWKRGLGLVGPCPGDIAGSRAGGVGIPDDFQREGEASVAGAVQPTLKVLHCRNNLPCCASPACCPQSRNCPTVSRRDAGSSLELWGGNGGKKRKKKKPTKLRVNHAGFKHCSVSPRQLQNQVKKQNPKGNCPNHPLLVSFEQFKHNYGILMLEKPSKALKSNLNSLNFRVTSTPSLNIFSDEKCWIIQIY